MSSTPSIWKQPAQVWAVAFACVVAFMGIGLVDPILPAIAESLEASPVETELLFTSYLVVTGLAMLVTSWISSRIGAKATLLVGLGLIVVFALFCALSGSVDAVIGFRAGWGLGNALFISTALATIVGAASGGSSAAIILYEAALGLGIAVLSSVLPYSLELIALRHLAQHVFGILLSLEPVVAALAGLVVLHQVLDRGQVAGMALVVLASAVVLGAQSRPESADAGMGPG